MGLLEVALDKIVHPHVARFLIKSSIGHFKSLISKLKGFATIAKDALKLAKEPLALHCRHNGGSYLMKS